MEKWEYWSGFLWAHVDTPGVREYLKRRYPDWSPPRNAPQAMIPQLNEFGEEGWELVHMEPVAEVGKNYDVFFAGQDFRWSNTYFCVFKRRIQPSS